MRTQRSRKNERQADPKLTKIHGIPFDIEWSAFVPHSSFFIPCLDTKTAKKTLFEECGKRNCYVRIRITIEEGVRGVRVWRLR